MESLLSRIIFGTQKTIPEMMLDDFQATFLGLSSMIFGISPLFFGVKNLLCVKKTHIFTQNRQCHYVSCLKLELLDATYKSDAPSL